MGDIVSESTGDFISVRLGDFVGIRNRGQGKTQTKVFALFDNPHSWNAKTAYVSMTRHKAEVNLYASADVASDEPTLARLMARTSEDSASIAYNVFGAVKAWLSERIAELADLRKRMGSGEGLDLREWRRPTVSTSKRVKRARSTPSSQLNRPGRPPR